MNTASGMYMPKNTFSGRYSTLSGQYSTLSGYYGTPPPLIMLNQMPPQIGLIPHSSSCADFCGGSGMGDSGGILGMGSDMDAAILGLMGGFA